MLLSGKFSGLHFLDVCFHRFLDEWSELLPTDGVHIEPILSGGQTVDAFSSSTLVSGLATSAAERRLTSARADAVRAGKPP